MKKFIPITTSVAPALYSQAILDSSPYRLEISGQLGTDPAVGGLVAGGIEAQTRQALKNVEGVLAQVGWTLENLVKVRIFLVDMNDYVKMNEVYTSHFKNNPPARLTVAVKGLPLGGLIEMECTATGDEV